MIGCGLPLRPRAAGALVALLAASAVPATARAQAAAVSAHATVRGVAYDSLLLAPLPRARVWIGDGTRWTTSDSAGRFLLDSIPLAGAPTLDALLLAEHPAADSVGLGALATRVRLRAGDTTDATIAIPSYATLRTAACRGIADAGDAEGGILSGTVRDAGTGAPVPAASVDVRWTSLRASTGSLMPESLQGALTATSGDDGAYYVCGVPAAFRLLVQARAGGDAAADSLQSDEVGVLIGARRILRRDLAVGAAAGATIVVTLASSDGRRVGGGRVFVGDGEPVEITDGAAGTTLRGVRAGTRVVGARAIGFNPSERVVDVAPGDTLRVALTLDAQPQQLATVRVDALLAAIEARRTAGGGFIMSGEELARAPTIGFAVPVVPSRVRDDSRAGILNFRVRGRLGDWCYPKVLLDGHRSGLSEVSSYRPDELLAVELYPEASRAPSQYLRPGEYDCGLLLVWTRKGAGY